MSLFTKLVRKKKLQPPSLFQSGVLVTHKLSKEKMMLIHINYEYNLRSNGLYHPDGWIARRQNLETIKVYEPELDIYKEV